LVEVVTDKVTMELPSPVAGSLVRILAQEGQTVAMGAPIAEVETAGAAEGAPPAPVPVPAQPAPAAAAGLASTIGYMVKDARPVGPTGGGPTTEGNGQPLMPAAPPAPEEPGAPQAPVSPPEAAPSGAAVRLSPAVRRLAQEHHVDLAQVQGTGLGGRITRDDVLRYLERPQPPAAPAPAPAPLGAAVPGAPADEEYVPLTPVRRMIAEAMVRSASQIPHAWSAVEADVTALVALRTGARAAFEAREGVELTYLPFVIKAVVEALKEHPTLNATWGGDKIVLKRRINLGIAVAAPHGLVVPVVHDADRRSIAGLARAARDLTQRARMNKLTLEDVHGGTFTLNNTGALGSVMSKPIINYPQAAILTFEAIQKRAVVRDDAIAIRSMMNLCLSFDHRINDGAQAGGFLQAVKRRLEAMGPDTAIY
jgi:2-oxoisovalerate dehydrogenase E2 component (dihydrolipoyl transacylase)